MSTDLQERRDRRRGIAVALALHTAVIAALLYPFLTGFVSDPEPYEVLVAVDFRQAAAQASAVKTTRTPTIKPTTRVKAAPKREAAPATPVDPSPPILVEKAPRPVVIPPQLSPKPDPTPAPAPGPVASDVEADGEANSDAGDTGSPSPGTDATVSDEGTGRAPIGAALEGDGILTRAVTYRPALGEIVRENGTVALNICINRAGRVIGVKWNEQRSTITDTELVRTAIAKARDYRFERDRSAPQRECGTLSITIDGV